MEKNLFLPFTALANRGVHQESKQEFEESFFKEIYLQAKSAVCLVVQENNSSIKTNKYNRRFDLYRTPNIQNVISFTGRRGTGKTSAMINFANALHNGEYANGDLEGVFFFAIPCIDAAMLNKNEDIFDVILSNMLLTLENEVDKQIYGMNLAENSNLSEIKKKMCSVFNQHDSLKKRIEYLGGSNLEDEVSSYYSLINTAKKHDIRNNFAQLVQEYVSFLEQFSLRNSNNNLYSKDKSYLVICIDDIDMASVDHMEILQCIYQYLMIPQVIVLTSFNVDVLSDVIEKHFYELFSLPNDNVCGEHDNITRKNAKEQAYDFLRKINSSDMRITLPSWKRMDYRSLIEIQVNLGKKETKNLNKINHVFSRLKNYSFLITYLNNSHENDDIIISPKKLIMFMLADRTAVYLDGNGKKLHFMEPDSLRNLYDLFYLFYNFEDIRAIGNGKIKYDYENMQKLRANFKMLLDHFHFKMVHELGLSDNEYQLFKDLCYERVTRRGLKIQTFYNKLIKEIKMDLTNNPFTEINEVECAYSYGELFRILYISSREKIFSKAFIKAILVSYSFVLPYTFMDYIAMRKEIRNVVNPMTTQKASETEQKISETRNDLHSVFGNTLLGRWNNSVINGRTLTFTFKKKDYNDFVQLFIMLMLHPDIDSGYKTIKLNEGLNMTFDPTAFVMNTFRNNEFIKLYKNVIEQLSLEENETYKQFIVELEKMLKKYNEKNYFALPLQHTDLVYSVMKRAVYRKLYQNDFSTDEKTNNENAGEFLPLLQKIYISIYEEIKRVDEFYDFNGSDSASFSNHFLKCPIVYCVLKSGVSDELLEDYELSTTKKLERFIFDNGDENLYFQENYKCLKNLQNLQENAIEFANIES